MPARSIDTARIAFGLVTIPVKIYSTNEPSQELHFHMVHEGCGQRLKQQYVCPEHGKVERDEIVSGFELAKGNVVELTKEELRALDAVASDDIALVEFVPVSAIDPLFVEHSYYLAPDRGGDRAYRLFHDALAQAGIAGIASYAARGKQYVVMLRPYLDGLVMHQLRYPDEIKPWSEIPIGKLPKGTPAELGLASQLIESLTHEKFDPRQYSDEVKGRVRKLIAQKAKGGEIVVPEGAPRPEIPDLMAALKASLTGASPSKKSSNGKSTHANSSRERRAHAPARRSTATARKSPALRTQPARSRAAGRAHN